jgi:hypothetical protein
MKPVRVPKVILRKARLITGRRAKLVVDHILRHGSVSTEDLEKYGYKHPPRAIRDVREQGLPLEMFRTKSSGGRNIASYRFGDPNEVKHDRLGGRSVLSKRLRNLLVEAHGFKCGICLLRSDARYFQIDHRIPYEVSGEMPSTAEDVSQYMPLCASCNRAKSWSCEHCPNWSVKREVRICNACYWASPENYTHIGTREIRRLDIVWLEKEVTEYGALANAAKRRCEPMPDYVKEVLRKHVLPKIGQTPG